MQNLHLGPGDAFGQRLGYLEHYGKSLFDVEACSFGTIHCITRDHLREALGLFPEEYEKIRYGLVLSLDITRQVRNVQFLYDTSFKLNTFPISKVFIQYF